MVKMNDLMGVFYGFPKLPNTREGLDLQQRLPYNEESTPLEPRPNPSVLSSRSSSTVGPTTFESFVGGMKSSFTHSSPLSSPILGVADPDIDSSDSEDLKFADEFGDSRLPFESSAHRDDPSSDSSRDSTPNPGQFWKCLSKKKGKTPEAPEIILCFWCKRVCDMKPGQEPDADRGGFPLTNGDRHFCSEICFTQCRRASFKKSKVCDWCRHVRSTVSYVDFNDGNHQLQFCGDKCLNQYKMHIFCRETEAHLQLHPHLNDLKLGKEGTLITPDLWLKDCDESKPKENHKDSAKETEVDESEDDLKDQESSEKVRVSSSSSVGDVSPVSFLEDSEPVNLSTNDSRSRSPMRLRANRGVEDYRTRLTTRYGRPPKHSSTDAAGHHLRSKCPKKASPNREGSEGKPKGMIRVRQLEEQQPRQQQQKEAAESSITSSLSPSTTTTLPGFTGFGGLLMGSRPPLLPGLPNLLPPPPSDGPRPQILPQLLLSHPDLLRLQGIRHPFVLPQPPPPPPPPPPIHAPPPLPPPLPSQSLPTPSPNPPKPSGFPPVTVLLPLPLPIPIPIPIPLPIPIPMKELEKLNSALMKDQTDEETGGSGGGGGSRKPTAGGQETQKKERNSDASPESHSSKRKGNNAVEPSLLLHAQLNRASNPKCGGERDLQTKSSSGGGETSFHEPLKADRKERRSILRYTSDVYEINGVFVPRGGGGWDGLPAATSKDEKKGEEFNPVAPEAPSTQKPTDLSTTSPKEDGSRPGVSRKRPSENDINQPLTKKKHLLT